MSNSWIEEAWRFAFFLFVGVVFGLVTDYLLLILTAILLSYAILNLYNLYCLVHWLNDPDVGQIPVHFGIWGEIYAKVIRMRSGHKQREKRLSQLLAQFQASAAALPDAAVVLGAQGDIRWFNDAAKGLLKLRTPLDLGQPLVNLFRAPPLGRYLEAGEFSSPLEVAAPGDNTRRLAVRVTDYGSGDRLLLAQDITDRVMAEQIRKDFVANVSHELRTPLTVISGFVENMQLDGGSIPSRWQKPVELIAAQAERMRHIVEDLLLLARLESTSVEAPREQIDVSALINAVAAEGRTLAAERLDIEVVIESDARLAGEPGQLRSVFTNLVMNAIQYTPDGGRITLIWRDAFPGCVFAVEDTGEGVAIEHIPRLTERFYRVDVGRSRERGGTGLGLAIVKHILQRHGARLEVESVLGEGSRFSCHFPADRRLPAVE